MADTLSVPGATGERKGKAMNATKMGLGEFSVTLEKGGKRMTTHDLASEVSRRLESGACRVSLREMDRRLSPIGYQIDRSMDCKGVNRIMAGPHARSTYPAVDLQPREIDTGRGAYNVQARRDANYRRLQDEMRDGMFAVSRGRLYSL